MKTEFIAKAQTHLLSRIHWSTCINNSIAVSGAFATYCLTSASSVAGICSLSSVIWSDRPTLAWCCCYPFLSIFSARQISRTTKCQDYLVIKTQKKKALLINDYIFRLTIHYLALLSLLGFALASSLCSELCFVCSYFVLWLCPG